MSLKQVADLVARARRVRPWAGEAARRSKDAKRVKHTCPNCLQLGHFGRECPKPQKARRVR